MHPHSFVPAHCLDAQCMVQTNIAYTLIVQTKQRVVENSSSVITCAHYCAIHSRSFLFLVDSGKSVFFMLYDLNAFV